MTTIFAQSSPYGKSGIAVYRISGKDALRAAKALTGRDKFEARFSYFNEVRNPSNNQLIDEGVVVYFQSPKSFTGEDLVEFYLHGSIAVSKIMLDTLSKMEFLRMAEPGEFSKRAFINGKIDLTAAEGIADLIDAETVMQHSQAIKQMTGLLAEKYENWRKVLLKLMSYIEAFIDFPDEEIPSEIMDEVNSSISLLITDISSHLNDNKRGEKLRSGINLAIFGPPNVGKSSLMNYLANRDIAIVSDIAGTTRDFIETFIDIEGYPICLVDTAGIRENTQDLIEQEGINRAIQKTRESDIKILMLDVETDFHNLDTIITGLIDPKTIVVINKVDIKNPNTADIKNPVICISLKSGQNLELLLREIKNQASNIAGLSEHPNITRARHRQNIELALQSLQFFDLSKDLVLAAEDLRQATRYLSFITGKITVEDILGEIFSSFCIGK
jgi:tRNA modification GTPase